MHIIVAKSGISWFGFCPSIQVLRGMQGALRGVPTSAGCELTGLSWSRSCPCVD